MENRCVCVPVQYDLHLFIMFPLRCCQNEGVAVAAASAAGKVAAGALGHTYCSDTILLGETLTGLFYCY